MYEYLTLSTFDLDAKERQRYIDVMLPLLIPALKGVIDAAADQLAEPDDDIFDREELQAQCLMLIAESLTLSSLDPIDTETLSHPVLAPYQLDDTHLRAFFQWNHSTTLKRQDEEIARRRRERVAAESAKPTDMEQGT